MMTAWALLDAERGTERAAWTAESLSKLAAIATIADCIPLFGAGRTHLDLREYTPEFEQLIRRFEPFGIGNPAPVFRIRKALLGKAKAYASTLTQGSRPYASGTATMWNSTSLKWSAITWLRPPLEDLSYRGWPNNTWPPLADM